MNGPCREGHSARKEVEDLDALVDRTQAHNVFGLSVGALIAIEAARTLPAISRLALYEPLLEFDGITQTAWLPRYERELGAGQPAAALVTIMKGTANRTAFRLVPRFLLTSAFGHVIRATEGRPVPAGRFPPATSSPRCTTTRGRSWTRQGRPTGSPACPATCSCSAAPGAPGT